MSLSHAPSSLKGEMKGVEQGMRAFLGLDMGTHTTVLHRAREGIVLMEPTAIATDRRQRVLAVGSEVEQFRGRTHSDVRFIRPIQAGQVGSFNMTVALLTTQMERIVGRLRKILPAKVVIALPNDTSHIELRAWEEAVSRAGGRLVGVVDQTVAAALGMDLDLSVPRGRLVVDIGAGKTQVALLSIGGIVSQRMIASGGDEWDKSLVRWMRNVHGLFIGEITAEQAKLECSRCSLGETVRISGRDSVSGLPKAIEAKVEDIHSLFKPHIDKLTEEIRSVLEKCPIELLSDIYDDGIFLTGGGALWADLDHQLEQRLQVACHRSATATKDVALGIGRVLPHMHRLPEKSLLGRINYPFPLTET